MQLFNFAIRKFTKLFTMTELEENPIIQRLKQFIASTGLSPTQFADKAMIPRPSLSQMLHGRNKSINNQILSKLDEAFPELDIVWLLFGRGTMHNSANIEFSEPQNAAPEASTSTQAPDAQQVTSASDIISRYQRQTPNGISGDEKPSSPTWHASVICESPNADVIKKVQADTKGKKITSIIVLYSDNSFETFNPAD